MIKKKYLCLNCDEERDFYTKPIHRKVEVKGVIVEVDVEQAYCKECGREIFVFPLEKKNQIKIYDAYKKKMGLLTSEDIIAIRKRHGISQSQLADSIRIGQKNIARYENGAIQDKSIDLLIRIYDDPVESFEMFDRNSSRDNLLKSIKEYLQRTNMIDELIDNQPVHSLNDSGKLDDE